MAQVVEIDMFHAGFRPRTAPCGLRTVDRDLQREVLQPRPQRRDDRYHAHAQRLRVASR